MNKKKQGLSKEELLKKYGDQEAPDFNKVLKKTVTVKRSTDPGEFQNSPNNQPEKKS